MMIQSYQIHLYFSFYNSGIIVYWVFNSVTREFVYFRENKVKNV